MLSSTEPCVWLVVQEVQALWGLSLRSVQYAMWQDKVKARQSVVGVTWMLEYNSCVARWGEVKEKGLLAEIIGDVNYGN